MDFTILAFCHPYCLEGKCNMHLSEIWHSKKNDSRLSRTQVNSFTGQQFFQHPHSKRSPFACKKGSFCIVKGLLLKGKRIRFEVQKDSFCECGVRKGKCRVMRVGCIEMTFYLSTMILSLLKAMIIKIRINLFPIKKLVIFAQEDKPHRIITTI